MYVVGVQQLQNWEWWPLPAQNSTHAEEGIESTAAAKPFS
jgi:hypothetical protein